MVKLSILLFALALAVHAEDPSATACARMNSDGSTASVPCAKPDPALAYQTARAEAAEAALAVAQRMLKDAVLNGNMNAAAANYCTLDWGDLKQMQAKADAAKKALEVLKLVR